MTANSGDEDPIVFTVIIPTHGRPDHLRSCLESLAAQQYPRSRFEVIVVDDGSDIPAAQVAGKYRDRLHMVVSRQARAGPATARNQGASIARGCYIAFIDDDCVAEPGWLEALDSGFRAHPRGVLLGGDITNPLQDNVCAEVGELILRVLLERYRPEPGGLYFFRSANLAVSRDEFRASGGFDPRFETAEDREFCDRWLYGGRALSRVQPAAVAHASPLDFRGFLYRHYRYGRGAHRFHRLRRRRGSGRFRLQFLWFYVFVLQACFVSKRSVVRKVTLVFLWLACSLIGFVAECFSELGGSVRHRGTS